MPDKSIEEIMREIDENLLDFIYKRNTEDARNDIRKMITSRIAKMYEVTPEEVELIGEYWDGKTWCCDGFRIHRGRNEDG